MKIAVPTADGKLTQHFGHCAGFDAYDISDDGKTITAKTWIEAPPHEPGLLPRFLDEKGVTHIIAGGMGARARDLFAERGIKVCVGAQAEASEKVVANYLAGTLITGENACDH
jgi:predicted Fe-Mo cluster-binding NifX family protein